MRVEIFNVGHGSCSVITSNTGKRMMIDCGHNSDPLWRPSSHYAGEQIELLAITNFDEDHVSDFPGLVDRNVRYIAVNPSVSPDQLAWMKRENGMGPGIARLHQWMASVAGRPAAGSADLGEISYSVYNNAFNFPFDTPNNLSNVFVVTDGFFKIVFPGDMERDGMRHLLRNPSFRNALRGTNVLMAPHHGRENGCCQELFNVDGFAPTLTVMSDKGNEHSTQETVPWYGNRSTGVNCSGGGMRRVLTTRNDGKITFDAESGGWQVSTSG